MKNEAKSICRGYHVVNSCITIVESKVRRKNVIYWIVNWNNNIRTKENELISNTI